MSNIKSIIKEFLFRHGINIVGFGAIPDNTEIYEIAEKLPRVIVFGLRLSKTVLSTVKDKPTLIYKHHYKTINWLLDQTSFLLVQTIESQRYQAVAIPASQVIDWTLHKGHLSHRHLAAEAGLGYIGRRGMLVHPEYGAQVRYTSVLTDLAFEPDKKIGGDCGNCRKCIIACPAKALNDDGADIKKCFEKLDEFSRIRGIGQHICGVCVKVCDGTS